MARRSLPTQSSRTPSPPRRRIVAAAPPTGGRTSVATEGPTGSVPRARMRREMAAAGTPGTPPRPTVRAMHRRLLTLLSKPGPLPDDDRPGDRPGYGREARRRRERRAAAWRASTTSSTKRDERRGRRDQGGWRRGSGRRGRKSQRGGSDGRRGQVFRRTPRLSPVLESWLLLNRATMQVASYKLQAAKQRHLRDSAQLSISKRKIGKVDKKT